ncbi:serine/threonine-protein kinase Pink1, mitochondrial [Sitodiplosis mosellana]|uniref:serine/threonine-protein kinase Pink1, mitochondrial n=1 Tax=Sitodiplosis mosellana TaxID=263140 RepID=UPI002443E7BE|nr:serine/threonine-protein kinase Pink1, mitochondrial [Sitodiplosis mosellana]
MSFRLLGHRLFQHGRQLVYNQCIKRNIHINILDPKKNRGFTRQIGLAAKEGIANSNQWALRNNTLIRFGQHARRLFVDNILNRITPIYSADLRNEATKKFLFGDSVPLFALIGICLASGNGIITKDDELEGVCWEIREAVSRLHDTSKFGRGNVKDKNELELDDLIVGAPIAKGCSAVVYAAAFKDNRTEASPLKVPDYDSDESSNVSTDNDLSPMRDVNRYVHNFGSSLENPHFLNRNPNTTNVNQARETKPHRKVLFNSKPDVKYQSNSNSSRHDANSERNSNESSSTISFNDEKGNDIETYPLALKMMFNYDIQSNAMAILRAMYKETIPAMKKYSNADADGWEKQLMEQTVQLPPHPNIVLMVGVFCAQVPNLMQSSSLYPMALPQRLNPQGYGRNMSLFLLMKRYEYSLCEYLKSSHDISMRTRLLLFAQLLEGVAHLYRHGVAHRDLKSDNILIDLNGNDVHPILVLSDFGCCLADKNNGLTVPYTSMDIDKGGNTALMPPEIITKTPGTFSMLNYSKSDLWACGAIAYEIFDSINPFYGQSKDESTESPLQPILKSAKYQDEQLPSLNENVPLIVRKLITNILHRNPNHRLSPDIAANVMQLFLWAPSSWLKPTVTVNNPEILQWLLSLTTKVLYEARLGGTLSGNRDTNDKFGLRNIESNRTHTEYLLLSSFLIRSQLQQIRSALEWIHQTMEETN